MRRAFIITILSLALSAVALQASANTWECICTYRPAGGSCSDASTIETLHTGMTQEADKSPLPSKDCSDACDAKGKDSNLECSVGWLDTTPQAGSTGSAPVVKLVNPLNVNTVPQLANNIIKTVVGLVGALALLTFIYGGLRWLTSAGEPAKIQAGKDAMKWAAIGLVVVFASFALVSFVFKALTG